MTVNIKKNKKDYQRRSGGPVKKIIKCKDGTRIQVQASTPNLQGICFTSTKHNIEMPTVFITVVSVHCLIGAIA